MITALLSVLVPLVSAATPPRIEVEMFPQTAIVGDPINIVLNPSKDIAMVESSWLLVKGNAKDLRVGKKVRVEKRKDGSVKVAHTLIL